MSSVGPPAVFATGNPGRDAERALRAMLEQGRVPHGLGIFLKAARVAEAGEGTILIELPSGPGLERLSGESPARAAVQATLSELLGTQIRLAVRSIPSSPDRGTAADPPARITPQRVRTERLARISHHDPALKEAVEAWDLELLD